MLNETTLLMLLVELGENPEKVGPAIDVLRGRSNAHIRLICAWSGCESRVALGSHWCGYHRDEIAAGRKDVEAGLVPIGNDARKGLTVQQIDESAFNAAMAEAFGGDEEEL